MALRGVSGARTALSPRVGGGSHGSNARSPQLLKLYHHEDTLNPDVLVSRSLDATCSPRKHIYKRPSRGQRTPTKRGGENAAPSGAASRVANKRGKPRQKPAKQSARRCRSKTPSRCSKRTASSSSSVHTPGATARAKALLAHTAACSAATARGTNATGRTHSYHTPKRGHRALVEPHSGSTAATCTPGSTPGVLTPGSVKEVRGVAAYLRRMRGSKQSATPASVVLSPASCASAATPHSARSNHSARSGRSVRSGCGRALWRRCR